MPTTRDATAFSGLIIDNVREDWPLLVRRLQCVLSLSEEEVEYAIEKGGILLTKTDAALFVLPTT